MPIALSSSLPDTLPRGTARSTALIRSRGQQVEIREREQVVTTVVSAQALAEHRERFPAMLDADAFTLG